MATPDASRDLPPASAPMTHNEYHFVTRWNVAGTREEVFDVLAEATGLTRWWPSVYLEIERVEPGDLEGVGSVYDLWTKGWLPYTLRWRLTITERSRPDGFSLSAGGDFVGRGVWKLTQQGDRVAIVYDWRIRAEKPLLRLLSPVLKPVFAFNHEWAMARGLESLELELSRRRARTAEERAAVAAPPPPTSRSVWRFGVLYLGIPAIAIVALVAWLRSP